MELIVLAIAVFAAYKFFSTNGTAVKEAANTVIESSRPVAAEAKKAVHTAKTQWVETSRARELEQLRARLDSLMQDETQISEEEEV